MSLFFSTIKKKKVLTLLKTIFFLICFFKHQFFSLVLLEQKFAEIICHKNSFNKKKKNY